jgi:hypothetical protein
MSIHPKLLSVLAIFQVTFIIAGFAVTRAFLHIHDEIFAGHTSEPFTPTVSEFAVFIRDFGLWFLLIPLAWCFIAATRGETYRGIVSVPDAQFLLGVSLTVGVAIFFSVTAFVAFQTL